MVFKKLKEVFQERRKKERPPPHIPEQNSNLLNASDRRAETRTSLNARGRESDSAISPGEQSTASQERQKSKAVNAGHKDELGVNVVCPGSNPIVDIVFLHGLSGKRDSTWTSAGSETPWPEVLLGEDMERARIVTYGYDANVVRFVEPAGQDTIRQHSSNLLLDLGNLRGNRQFCRGRPIIFVVHSLGGLVIEDAIFYGHNSLNEAYVDISKSTRGVIFFGTPHAGSDFTKFAQALANLIQLSFFKKPNKDLLNVLNRNSTMLANIENNFMGLVRRRANGDGGIDLFAFLESLPVKATGHRVVTPESAIITGYSFASINADHMGMTKFGSRNADYQRVLGVLQHWVDSIQSSQDLTQKETDESNLDEPNDVNFGRQIYFRNRSSVKNHIKRFKLLQTIHKEFEVREDNRSSIVILQALGGQGKTQLAIDYCYQNWKQRKYHAVFFLDASSEQTLRREMISLVDILKRPGQVFENDDQRYYFVFSTIKSWNRPWLLVLDNYDKPQSFPNINKNYIPHSNYGNILVTTRHRGLDELGKTLPIPAMSPEEASDLLITASGVLDRTNEARPELSSNEKQSAIDIVNRLERLPLAVRQAAAYIRYKELNLAEFMDEYDSRKAAIWSRTPALWEYGQTVYTTWELSYGLIDEDYESRQRKGALLTMLAFLDYRSISRELFNVPRAFQNLEAHEDQILELVDPVWLREVLRRDGNWDIPRVEDRLDLFRDLSLLQILDRSKSKAYKISFHPLVADWVKYRVHSDKLTEHQCLFQASVLVVACLKDQARPQVASLLSEQAREEVLRHQAACLAMLNKLREEDSSAVFTPAIEMISKDIQELPEMIQRSRDDQSSQYRRNVLQWLSPTSQEDVYLQHRSSKVAGTCDWINHDDAFVQWEAGQVSVLLINGPPGSGKTVLTASILEKFQKHKSKSGFEAVIFSFVQFRDFGAWSASHVLRSLLQQILNEQQDIPKIVGDMYRRFVDCRQELSVTELQNALALTVRKFQKIWILVDAVDQLGDDRTSLITTLVGLATQVSQNQNIHIALTSRDVSYYVEPAISGLRWINTRRIDIMPDQVEDDIRICIQAFKTQHLNERKAHKAWENFNADELVTKANGSFLWARLVLDEMISDPIHPYFKQQLHTSPNPLNDFYDQIIKTMSPEAEEVVYWTLAFLCVAPRPVSHLEVQYAVASLATERTLVLFSMNDSETLLDIDTIIEQCRGLVTLNAETGILAASHLSVREWYLDTKSVWHLSHLLHQKVALMCLSYFFQFCSLPRSLKDQFLEYPLLSYSARYWAYHMSHQPKESWIRKFLLFPEAVAYWLRVLRAEAVMEVEIAKASVPVKELEEILPRLWAYKEEHVRAFAEKLGFSLTVIRSQASETST